MTAPLLIRVYGDPRPQGSKRAFATKGGKAVMIESSGDNLKTWRGRVAAAVLENRPARPIEGAVYVFIDFLIRQPKKTLFEHPTGRNVGDLSKLIRAVEDELSGVAIGDDSQITYLRATKAWADEQAPGAVITVGAV